MARSLTYLDIPAAIRQESASKVRANLQAMLVNPAYTNEQRNDILRQLSLLSLWENGAIPMDGVTVKTAVVQPGPGAIKSDFGE